MKIWQQFRAFCRSIDADREKRLEQEIINEFLRRQAMGFSMDRQAAHNIIERVRDHDKRGVRFDDIRFNS